MGDKPDREQKVRRFRVGFPGFPIFGYFRSWASTATNTRPAPARRNARAASLAVVPVVRTSSTSKTVLFVKQARARTLKAPRTFFLRSAGVCCVCLGVERVRTSQAGQRGNLKPAARPRARASLWL